MDTKKLRAINMIGKQTNNEGFFAVPAPENVVIDGCLDDWDLSGQIESYADSSVKDAFSVKTAAMWNEDYLFLAFDWRDPYPLESQYNPMQDPTRGWMSDSVQLRFLCADQPSWFTTWCFEGDKPAIHVEYNDKGSSNNLKPRDVDSTVIFYNGTPGENDLGNGVLMAYRKAEDGKGFTQEIRLPWNVLYDCEKKASVGDIIRLGLDFHWGQAGGYNRPIHGYCDNVRPGGGMRVFFWTQTNNWGDLVLAAGSVEKRIYREEMDAPEGTIPLRVKVPANAKTFTVTINTPDGRRVRNVAGGMPVAMYKIAESDGLAEVEVLWNGLDESGKLVPAGEYVLKGLTANGLDGYYESGFYNPGTPAWSTSDTRGGWGADHTTIKQLTAAGQYVILSSTFAEGGFGTFAIDTEGERAYQKCWGDLRGTNSLAANDKYVFLIPNDWAASGVELLRMDPQTGKFLPFQRNGKDTPMPYRISELFNMETPPVITALALYGNTLLMRLSDHTVRAVNADTGYVERVYSLTMDNMEDDVKVGTFGTYIRTDCKQPLFYDVATDGKGLYYIANNQILRLDLATGECAETALSAAEIPSSIDIDKDGAFYIADFGKRHQVIKCDENGNELFAYGIKGGRPRAGKYVADGFLNVCSIALDAHGDLWVAEDIRRPRRISVWTPEGKLKKEYIGNAGYAGQDTLIHNNDPKKAFAEYCEMAQAEDGSWHVENVMYNPDPEAGLSFNPGVTPFDQGSMFFSEASGEKREYFVAQGWHRHSMLFIMMKQGDVWKPVAGVAPVSNILNRERIGQDGGLYICPKSDGEWSDCDPMDIVFWNDFDGNGLISRSECTIVPTPFPSEKKDGMYVCDRFRAAFYHCTSGSVGTDDLSFYITKIVPDGKNVICVVKPVGYRDNGMPIYLPSGIEEITDEYRLVDSSYPIPGKDLMIAFIELEKKIYVAGMTRSTGKILWKYLSPYHEVHGSHHAPMCKPGLMIGCLKVAGLAKNCGDSDVIMIRGNLGEDYYLTTDGEYIDTLTRDERLPGLAVPDTVEELKKISFRQFAGRGEHFSGRFTKHDDGVTRCHGGMPACEGGNIIRVEGLENVRHFAPVTVNITDAQIVQADAANQERDLSEHLPKTPVKAAKDMGDAEQFAIEKDGQVVKGSAQIAYDEELLKLRYEVNGIRWVNGGNNWHTLFKTGDCVDFQLSPTGNTKSEAAAGDFRLLIAPFEGKETAVLMRMVDTEKSSSDDAYKYTSPVQTAQFDTVRRVENAEICATKDGDKVVVEATVPWAALDMSAPVSGAKLTGDFGIIVADPSGKTNIARIYRNNSSTNLVNDMPGEARIMPNGFDVIQF